MSINIINSAGFSLSNVDELAVTIFIIGFGIVFLALVTIAIFFIYFSKIVKKYENRLSKEEKASKKNTKIVNKSSQNVNDEVYAAIAMALKLCEEKDHDKESFVLTIDINDSLNSQWNSKVLTINNF